MCNCESFFFLLFFQKFLEDTSPFYGTTDISVCFAIGNLKINSTNACVLFGFDVAFVLCACPLDLLLIQQIQQHEIFFFFVPSAAAGGLYF